MCQNWTTYIPGIERDKDASVPPQGPSLCLMDSVAPPQPAASAKQNRRMNGRYFRKHALLREMKPSQAAGTLQLAFFNTHHTGTTERTQRGGEEE